MNEMPVVEVHIVPSTAAPGGMGELTTPRDRAGGGQRDLCGDGQADPAIAVQSGKARLKTTKATKTSKVTEDARSFVLRGLRGLREHLR